MPASVQRKCLTILKGRAVIIRDTYRTKRQATQHDSLPSLLGDGDKGLEIVYGEIFFGTGPARAAKAEQKSLVPARQAQKTNQGWTTFICTL